MTWHLIDETTPKDSREVLFGWQNPNNPLEFIKFTGRAYPSGVGSKYFHHAKPTHWHEMVANPRLEVKLSDVPQVCPICQAGSKHYNVSTSISDRHIFIYCQKCRYDQTYLIAKEPSHA